MGRKESADFQHTRTFTSRLPDETLIRLKTYCRSSGVVLWKFLGRAVKDALDKAGAKR